MLLVITWTLVNFVACLEIEFGKTDLYVELTKCQYQPVVNSL